MPNIVNKTKLLEGQKRAIFHFYFESDGVEGELNNYVLIDPQQDFDLSYPTDSQLSITKMWYSSAIYDVLVKFNALVPTPAWVIVPDADSQISFEYFGGLKDYSGVEHDGKILVSTNGFSQAGSIGTMIIEVKKD